MAPKSGLQDVGHAVVVTGRDGFRLPHRKNRALPGFSAHAYPAGVKKSPLQSTNYPLFINNPKRYLHQNLIKSKIK